MTILLYIGLFTSGLIIGLFISALLAGNKLGEVVEDKVFGNQDPNIQTAKRRIAELEALNEGLTKSNEDLTIKLQKSESERKLVEQVSEDLQGEIDSLDAQLNNIKKMNGHERFIKNLRLLRNTNKELKTELKRLQEEKKLKENNHV